MKKPISTGMFLTGIVILTAIISFLIRFLFLNLNAWGLLSALLAEWTQNLIGRDFIGIIAIFVSAFIACKRYIVPAPVFRLACWVIFIYVIFDLLNLLAMSILLGSDKILALVSTQTIATLIINSVVVGGATYVALRLFSQSSSSSTTQV